uniref:Subtilisin-like protease n=1 Tax=Oryza meridionalis TaxID=40149 RepID=A0A0E0CS82_9ORYZ
MAKPPAATTLVLCCLLAVAAAAAATWIGHPHEQDDDVSTYIVHVMPAHAPRLTTHRIARDHYAPFLRELLLPAHVARPPPRLLYSYAHAATGFAARLTARQAAHLEAHPCVAAVVRDEAYELHTTLSSSFLRLSPSSGLQAESNSATDAVIAVLDTGIYPDHASFASDPSLSPTPPPTFRGECVLTPEFDASVYCNNKLVGAKMFYEGYERASGKPINETEDSKSPLDTTGHGTHSAAIAAGSPVSDANLFGLANGVAKGTAPGARIACAGKWGASAPTSSPAWTRRAIADGVDVISLSLAVNRKRTFAQDPTAISGFNAVRKGIVVVVASAGSGGPKESTVTNTAPWLLTVGASSMNHQFQTIVVLGDGHTFSGTSLYPGDTDGSMKSLVFGGFAGSAACEIGKLDATKVAGKIVLCEVGQVLDAEKGVAVAQAGGFGVIVSSRSSYGEYAKATAHLIPGTTVPNADALEILRYMVKTPYPVGKILFFGTVLSSSPSSPRIASFSARGPSLAAPEILKPDLVAPGVSILAAWSGLVSPTELDVDTRRVKFNILSGTSAACPHVSGVAALLKMARPSWTPAMNMSALTTTAYVQDSSGNAIADMATGKPAGPFELGAGHVDPNSALDPGLVYDAGVDDYLDVLCALGYSDEDIVGIFLRDGTITNCSTRASTTVADLNRASISVAVKAYGDEITVRRTVRNVGRNVDAVYTVGGVPPPGTQLRIRPSKLVFDAEHQTRTYDVVIHTVSSGSFDEYTHGSIVWSDGAHKVRSPIAVTCPPSQSAAVAAI